MKKPIPLAACAAILGDSIPDPRHIGTKRNRWLDLGDALFILK